MFSKILIANRGEIAVRIARTARQLGIGTVAVYSSADTGALHVESCDEAYFIGPAAASESYLNAARILEVAQKSGAEAIHPGYGFLSENAEFARACEGADIVFIGPPADAIEAMGSKSRAKALMDKAGVPLIPGYHGDAQQDDHLVAESKRVGYPQLIKASAGGGGKGMRLVEAEADFPEALVSARREASAAFGDDKMLIERYLSRPRHVEMQIFADRHGNHVHLFERDCSIQRRHQKVLEEAPAPGLGDGLRKRMGKAAIDCARAIGYLGAGTVEFLLDADGNFYFMEMNTRLQVEHPVSEMITALDLVEWQLQVAAGEPLPLKQRQIVKQGHALEARIYAENPERDFMPASGRIDYLQQPTADDGLRVDTGVRCGDVIGINYDPMIAKLVVHGPDRATAVTRMAQALQQYRILGLNTNLGFLTRLVSLPEFIAADFDTGFIGAHHERLFARDEASVERALVLAAAATLPMFDDRLPSGSGTSPWTLRNQWRMNLQPRLTVKLEREGSISEVTVEHLPNGWHLTCNGQDYHVAGSRVDDQHMRFEVDGQRIEIPVLLERDTVALVDRGQAFKFQIPHLQSGAGADATDADQPRAPMSGAVVALPVAVGDTVEPGTTLVVIEAMKMEHAIVATLDARVSEILVTVGDQVEEGDSLVLLEVE